MWTQLTEQQEVFLNSFSSKVVGDMGEWYYMPFWFKKEEGLDAVYTAYLFDELPEKFIKRLNKLRND